MVLQSKAGIIKGTGITKWGNYYKVGHYNLSGDRQYAPENSTEAETLLQL